jgi:hypothetical protein
VPKCLAAVHTTVPAKLFASSGVLNLDGHVPPFLAHTYISKIAAGSSNFHFLRSDESICGTFQAMP